MSFGPSLGRWEGERGSQDSYVVIPFIKGVCSLVWRRSQKDRLLRLGECCRHVSWPLFSGAASHLSPNASFYLVPSLVCSITRFLWHFWNSGRPLLFFIANGGIFLFVCSTSHLLIIWEGNGQTAEVMSIVKDNNWSAIC